MLTSGLLFLCFCCWNGDTDFRVNEIASSFRDILYNFKNLLYLLYRQDIGRPYDVIMPFGFFGIAARVLIFLGVFLLVIRLILALWKRQTTLLWTIFIQLTGALLLGLLFTVGIDWEHIDRNKIYVIYYTDAEKFDGFALLPYRDWYVAY